MKTDQLVRHLASVLGDNFNLTLEDVEKQQSEADKEIVYGLICLHDDLDFYKRKSELLLENFKNTLFSSAAITITGRTGVIKDANNYFLNLCGYEKKELLGKNIEMLDHKLNQSKEFDDLNRDIIAGKTWRGEVCGVKKNGEPFWINTLIFPIKNTEGDIYEYWSVSTDISERKEIELKLIEKNKELEQYSYLLSNNLKAPGRQINQLVGFIEEDHGESFNDDCKSMFKLLRTGALRLNKLIDGVLEYTGADYNNSSDSIVYTEQVLTEILKINHIPPNVEIRLDDNLPTIQGSKVKIEQIFQNFINNAINFSKKEKTVITISAKQDQTDFYTFEIRDNGEGIEEKNIESIFDMFTTAHGSSESESIGIGLAVNKKIIQAYGGEIGCRSVINEGSTFWFTWPQNASKA